MWVFPQRYKDTSSYLFNVGSKNQNTHSKSSNTKYMYANQSLTGVPSTFKPPKSFTLEIYLLAWDYSGCIVPKIKWIGLFGLYKITLQNVRFVWGNSITEKEIHWKFLINFIRNQKYRNRLQAFIFSQLDWAEMCRFSFAFIYTRSKPKYFCTHNLRSVK